MSRCLYPNNLVLKLGHFGLQCLFVVWVVQSPGAGQVVRVGVAPDHEAEVAALLRRQHRLAPDRLQQCLYKVVRTKSTY